MYYLNIIDGMYCVTSVYSNLIVAKFQRLEEAVYYINSSQKTGGFFYSTYANYFRVPIIEECNCCQLSCDCEVEFDDNKLDLTKEKEISESIKEQIFDLNKKTKLAIEDNETILNEIDILKSILAKKEKSFVQVGSSFNLDDQETNLITVQDNRNLKTKKIKTNSLFKNNEYSNNNGIKTKKVFKKFWISLSVLLLIIGSVIGGYFAYNYFSSKVNPINIISNQTIRVAEKKFVAVKIKNRNNNITPTIEVDNQNVIALWKEKTDDLSDMGINLEGKVVGESELTLNYNGFFRKFNVTVLPSVKVVTTIGVQKILEDVAGSGPFENEDTFQRKIKDAKLAEGLIVDQINKVDTSFRNETYKYKINVKTSSDEYLIKDEDPTTFEVEAEIISTKPIINEVKDQSINIDEEKTLNQNISIQNKDRSNLQADLKDKDLADLTISGDDSTGWALKIEAKKVGESIITLSYGEALPVTFKLTVLENKEVSTINVQEALNNTVKDKVYDSSQEAINSIKSSVLDEGLEIQDVQEVSKRVSSKPQEYLVKIKAKKNYKIKKDDEVDFIVMTNIKIPSPEIVAPDRLYLIIDAEDTIVDLEIKNEIEGYEISAQVSNVAEIKLEGKRLTVKGIKNGYGTIKINYPEAKEKTINLEVRSPAPIISNPGDQNLKVGYSSFRKIIDVKYPDISGKFSVETNVNGIVEAKFWGNYLEIKPLKQGEVTVTINYTNAESINFKVFVEDETVIEKITEVFMGRNEEKIIYVNVTNPMIHNKFYVNTSSTTCSAETDGILKDGKFEIVLKTFNTLSKAVINYGYENGPGNSFTLTYNGSKPPKNLNP